MIFKWFNLLKRSVNLFVFGKHNISNKINDKKSCFNQNSDKENIYIKMNLGWLIMLKHWFFNFLSYEKNWIVLFCLYIYLDIIIFNISEESTHNYLIF